MNTRQLAEEHIGKPNYGTIICTMAFHGILVYFFFIFAFFNVDNGSCYTRYGDNTGSKDPYPGADNVTKNFQRWFLFGFIVKVLGVL